MEAFENWDEEKYLPKGSSLADDPEILQEFIAISREEFIYTLSQKVEYLHTVDNVQRAKIFARDFPHIDDISEYKSEAKLAQISPMSTAFT